jgi:predicted dehydrogenase
MDKVRIGLVGISGFAKQHIIGIGYSESVGIASLEAVVVRPQDRDVEEFSLVKERGLRLYADYREMFEAEKDRLDLIALPVGIGFHAEMSIAALKSGFNVMCEKPAAGTMDEILAMRKAREETGKVLAIGFQNIYSPSIQRIKQIALNGTLGRLLEVRSFVSWPRDSHYYGRNNWAGKLQAGGKPIYDSPVQNATAHYLQNMLYVAGQSKHESANPVTLYGENYRAQPIESADTQFLRVETAEGLVIQFSTTHATNTNTEPMADYLFERGRIRWEMGDSRVYLIRHGEEELIETFDNGLMSIDVMVFLGVCSAILKGEQPLSTIENSYQQVLCVNKLFENCPIHTMGEEFIEIETGSGGGENYHVPGMAALQEKMFKKGLSFSETGESWAIAGKKCKL